MRRCPSGCVHANVQANELLSKNRLLRLEGYTQVEIFIVAVSKASPSLAPSRSIRANSSRLLRLCTLASCLCCACKAGRAVV